MKNLLYILICNLACYNTALSTPHPFNADDLNTLKRISSPKISPDGRSVVFELKKTDLNTNSSNRDLWLIDIHNKKPAKALTKHSSSDSNPIWTNNGQYIYFLSKRSGLSQVWRMKANGQQKKQITDFPISIYDLALSPNNRYLAFSANIYPGCDSLKCSAQKDQTKLEPSKPSGALHQQLFIRHWDSWENGKQSHLFTLELNKKGLAKNKPIRISASLNANTPPKPFGDSSDFTFSADSQYLFFTARVASQQQAWTTNLDIFKAAIDNSESILNLTQSNLAADSHPIVSSDGKWIAYLSMQRPGFESDRNVIKLINLSDGKISTLTADWDRSVSSMQFSSDNQHIIATAHALGQKPIFTISLQNAKVSQLSKQGNVSDFDLNGDTLIYGQSNFKAPTELFRMTLDGSQSKVITHQNDKQLSEIQFGDYEQFTFKGWNKEKVYGYIIKPANFKQDKQYPAILFIHGGPQGNFGNQFRTRWNSQIYSAAGYAVIIIDFHGSTGYGQAFTDSISGDWGGKPLIDLQKGLAAALKESPWIVSDDICAMGGSYGGYMINWIAGNWPDRFKCLVNHDGVIDNRMMYYTTEELWFFEWEHGGPYHENATGYEQHNPINHIQKWRTPMLVIQGGQDFRVPETQSIATFTTLQRLGIKSRLLYFSDENHWVLKPQNSIQWYKETLRWLDEHLK